MLAACWALAAAFATNSGVQDEAARPKAVVASREPNGAVTLTFHGPPVSETGTPNPFLDYRIDATFRHAETGANATVPCYFAADGGAADSGAESGDVWRAHFLPSHAGRWEWSVMMLIEPGIALQPARSTTTGPIVTANAPPPVRIPVRGDATARLLRSYPARILPSPAANEKSRRVAVGGQGSTRRAR